MPTIYRCKAEVGRSLRKAWIEEQYGSDFSLLYGEEPKLDKNTVLVEKKEWDRGFKSYDIWQFIDLDSIPSPSKVLWVTQNIEPNFRDITFSKSLQEYLVVYREKFDAT